MGNLSSRRDSRLNRYASPVCLICLLPLTAATMPLRADEQATPAAPNAAESQSTDTDAAGTIVVTGSRISRRDYNAESPIATLGSSAIAAAGQPSLDRAIGQMPQFEAAQGAAEVG
ncbi:MAG TPA: hypothetical protein VEY89_04120, partial [Candidatus Dormibacteraeota bacterium]|nr:hypothetical protein [Candidatus Dormibacteraeota bacterium]